MGDETRSKSWLWDDQIAEGVSPDGLVEAAVFMRGDSSYLLPQASARLLVLPSGNQFGMQAWVRTAMFRGQMREWAPAVEITGPGTTSSLHALKMLYDITLGNPKRSVKDSNLHRRVEAMLTAFRRTPAGWDKVVCHKTITLTESSWHMKMNTISDISNTTYVLSGREEQSVDDALLQFFRMLFLEEAPQAAVGS
jgi:hypothetical protein